jgi:hypothetical protein
LAVRRLPSDRRYAACAGAVGRWAELNDGASAAADAVEAVPRHTPSG